MIVDDKRAMAAKSSKCGECGLLNICSSFYVLLFAFYAFCFVCLFVFVFVFFSCFALLCFVDTNLVFLSVCICLSLSPDHLPLLTDSSMTLAFAEVTDPRSP